MIIVNTARLHLLGSGCANDKCVETCDEGWEKHGNHCYLWVTKKMNWTAAEDFCQEEGGHLASVAAKETMDFVNAGLASRGLGYVWLGGNDIAKEGDWKWTDCTPWELTFWAPGEPTNSHGYEDCLYHRRQYNNWNDGHCWVPWGVDHLATLCSKKICSDKGIVDFKNQMTGQLQVILTQL